MALRGEKSCESCILVLAISMMSRLVGRRRFGPAEGAQRLMGQEYRAAMLAFSTGLYVGTHGHGC